MTPLEWATALMTRMFSKSPLGAWLPASYISSGPGGRSHARCFCAAGRGAPPSEATCPHRSPVTTHQLALLCESVTGLFCVFIRFQNPRVSEIAQHLSVCIVTCPCVRDGPETGGLVFQSQSSGQRPRPAPFCLLCPAGCPARV